MTRATFADSSALVKLYADEEGAEDVRGLPLVVVSQLARVEVPGAIWKKHRIGDIGADAASVLVAEFEADFFGTADDRPRFLVVTMTDGILDDAAHLVGVHGLRANDAVQLASAMAVRATTEPDDLTFLAFDKALSAAAATEGLNR